MLSRKKQKIVAAIICGVLIVAMLAGITLRMTVILFSAICKGGL